MLRKFLKRYDPVNFQQKIPVPWIPQLHIIYVFIYMYKLTKKVSALVINILLIKSYYQIIVYYLNFCKLKLCNIN